MKEVREAVNTEELRQEMKESMAFPVELLNAQMKRLALKDKPFQVYVPAEDTAIDELWEKCQEVDIKLQVWILHSSGWKEQIGYFIA